MLVVSRSINECTANDCVKSRIRRLSGDEDRSAPVERFGIARSGLFGKKTGSGGPWCTDRPGWLREAEWDREPAPSTIPGPCRAVQGQCRAPPPHPEAAAPGHRL